MIIDKEAYQGLSEKLDEIIRLAPKPVEYITKVLNLNNELMTVTEYKELVYQKELQAREINAVAHKLEGELRILKARKDIEDLKST